MSLSDAMRDLWIGRPEQFYAVECLMRAAANAQHVAERAESWEIDPRIAQTLTDTAQANRDAATTLLIGLCPTADTFRTVWHEMTEMTAV